MTVIMYFVIISFRYKIVLSVERKFSECLAMACKRICTAVGYVQMQAYASSQEIVKPRPLTDVYKLLLWFNIT
jgi:hypothetical protein